MTRGKGSRAERRARRAEQSRRIELRAARNDYARGEAARTGMRSEVRKLFVLGVVCALVLLACLILPTYFFEHSMVKATLSTFLDEASTNLDNLLGVFTGDAAAGEQRFMGVLVCAVSGAALGMCGSAYQGAFNNSLAAPKTLGVMAGGALGALIYVVFLQDFGPEIPFNGTYTATQYLGWLSTLNPLELIWVSYGRCLCSLVGCFIVVGIVVTLTTVLGHGKLTNVVVIIFGQVFAATVTALISFARYYFTANGGIDMADELKMIENYTMIYSFGYQDLLIVVLPIVICVVIVMAMSRNLTLLSFGDDEAATMGVNVNRTRYAMIAVCTVMTAWAISFCGHVSYLGFVSAHIARRIVGPDFRYLLPASLFTGATLLTTIQWICPSGLPFTSPYAAGTVCSIVGALIFLGMVLVQCRRGDPGGWR